MHIGCTRSTRSAWPPCCCSSSRDNACNSVNAPSSEGVEQGNSGQGGLTGGLLSALMCITALLATSRSVLWGSITVKQFLGRWEDSNHRFWSDTTLMVASPLERGWISRSCRHNVCVCVSGRHSNADALKWLLGLVFVGLFRGMLHPAGGTKGVRGLMPEMLWMTKATLMPFKILKHNCDVMLCV